MLFDKELILKEILDKPLVCTKLFLLFEGKLIEQKTFSSNWALFNHLETLSVSNNYDAILIASQKPLVLSEIKIFMDGKLINFVGIISHNEEKFPINIEYFYKTGTTVLSGNAPFFLFKEPKLPVLENKPRSAALFSSSSSASFIAESIKLLEDAGYLISKTKIFSKPESKNIVSQVAEWINSESGLDTVAIFFEIKASNLSKLEKETGLEVLSREDLIISIFNSRAEGTSGKLKFASALIAKEKAQFRNKVQGLSRIKGGIGLKGPGETKEEERKRILKNREKDVRKLLKHETERLSIQRKFREKSSLKTVSIVGYTNAGKSTLFNSLLNRKVVVESDKYFSSIDPKIKKMTIHRKDIFLIDTVGFISEMSKDIIDAFQSTFSDVASSDLILHIIDSTSKGWEAKKKFVETLLLEKGIKKEKIVSLYSKRDLIRIKHPVSNGFFYSSLYSDDILKIKNFIFSQLFTPQTDHSGDFYL